MYVEKFLKFCIVGINFSIKLNNFFQIPPYSDAIGLGFTSRFVWSGACVSYVSMGYLNPCNVSNVSPDRFNDEGYNLQGYNREGFNRWVSYVRDFLEPSS